MTTTFVISTHAGVQARVCRLEPAGAASDVPDALGLVGSAPVVVVIGGAGSLDAEARERLRPLFVEGLAAAAERAGAVVIDGGTNAGVMRLAGESRANLGATFALVGVAAAGTIEIPGAEAPSPSAAPLEPHHTHLALVPGDQFGDESPWIADIASAIAGGRASVTVLVGGGAISWEDVENSVAVGRPVIIVDGSGGTADALARGLKSAEPVDRITRLASKGRFQIVNVSDGPSALRAAIKTALSEL